MAKTTRPRTAARSKVKSDTQTGTKSRTRARRPARETSEEEPVSRGTRLEKRQRAKRMSSYVWLGVCCAIIAAGIVAAPMAWKKYKALEERREMDAEAARRAREDSVLEVNQTIKYSGGQRERPERHAPVAPKEEIKESEAFLGAVGKAGDLFEQGEFAKAAALYDEAVRSGEAPEDSIDRARRLQERSSLFATLTKDIKPSVEADASNLFWVTMKNGGKFRAQVTDMPGNKIKIRKDNGISSVIGRDMVDRMERISQEDRNKEMRKDLMEAKSKTDRDGLSYYLLSVQAMKDNLKSEGVDLLKEAFDMDKDLAESVRNHYARKLFKQGVWFQGIGLKDRAQRKFDQIFALYPGTDAANLAREILDEAKKEGIIAYAQKAAPAPKPDEGKPVVVAMVEEEIDEEEDEKLVKDKFADISGKDADNIDDGNKNFDDAMDLIRKARDTDSGPKSSKYYKSADKALHKARTAYEKALKKDPDNPTLNQRLQEVNRQIYWARKMQRL